MKQKLLNLVFLSCLFCAQNLIGQTSEVNGTVTDANNGLPLPGVNVLIKGTDKGVFTNFDGKYSIEVANKTTTVLQFSFVGYSTLLENINGRSVVNVAISENAESLDEVVITALGIKKETKALGYSLTEVKGEELSTIKQPNAINSLQGKVAGVNVTQNATGAAGSSRVIIRGASSISGNNQPLYVVDGIPIGNDNNGSAGLWGGSDGGDGISSLNPDDIKTMSVLKGGAASALYGSRASNGVIIVTTKSGENKKGFGIELTSSVLFDKVNTSIQDFQTTYGQGRFGQKPQSQEEAQDIALNSWGPRLDGTDVVQWDGVARPYSYVGNNSDSFYRTASTLINTLAISSTNEKLNFRFSASNLDNEDIIPNSGLNRKTFSLNTGALLANKLTVNTNVKYIIENVKNRIRLSDAPGNANFTVANLSPNVDVRFMRPGTNPDGTELRYSSNVFFQNPYFAAFNFRNEDVKNRITASTSFRYDILDWMHLTTRAGVDHYTIKRIAVEPWGTAYIPNGSIRETEFRYTQVDADIILGVEKDLTDKFSLNAFVGANSNHIKSEELILAGNDFIVPNLEDIANTRNQSRSRNFSQRKIGSLYGSIELSYNNFAYLTFTGRNDWFSTLSFPGKTTPNNDFYPSVNASLVLSEMFEMPEQVNFLKLRGGYSEVAGGADQAYQLALTYQIFGQGHLGQPLGNISNSQVPNANLVAFNKSETEVGIDTRLFSNRLSFDIAYYNNKTTNDIVPVTTSVFSGYGSAFANIGVLENKGIEFLVSVKPIVTDNFTWSASLNGSFNKGTIISTDENNGSISLGEPRTRNIEVKQIVGEAYGALFGVSYERDDNGNIIYDYDSSDPNAVPLARIGERKILGDGVPPLTMGLSNTFTYKNFTLSFLIDGKFGGQIFSGTNAITFGNGLHKGTLAGRENGLSVSGIDSSGQSFTTTVAPEDLQIYYGRINDIAEEFVEDSDYIKFRQLSFGYSFPDKMLDKIFLNDLKISLTASNLFFLKRSISNIDPEAGYNVGNAQGLEYFGLPSTRSVGMNISLKF